MTRCHSSRRALVLARLRSIWLTSCLRSAGSSAVCGSSRPANRAAASRATSLFVAVLITRAVMALRACALASSPPPRWAVSRTASVISRCASSCCTRCAAPRPAIVDGRTTLPTLASPLPAPRTRFIGFFTRFTAPATR
ncbi:hypothetical protein GCM10022247_39960 [Allokutzneria multivorans]|uniref:Secreted protein n=1 Tax=Allokutzneria multivorans TaxID=1142134 RepID=A0ABP7SLA1_9PSEU